MILCHSVFIDYGRKNLLRWMNPLSDSKLIDVAAGTGDIAKLFSKKNNNTSEIICVEPNMRMFEEGKANLKKFNNIKWVKAPAENLPFNDNIFDFYTISYGIRNVTDINKTLSEAFRVLKPGGRFMCLEFSKVDNEILSFFYRKYSKTIPLIGKYIVGDIEPYEYLVSSINQFYNQNELIELMINNGFSNTEYRNLSAGVTAIHSGWKI